MRTAGLTPGVAPVGEERIISAKSNFMAGAGLGQRLDDIALKGRGIDDVIGTGLRREHGEAIVMLGCDHEILHPGIVRERCPGIGIKLGRVELRRELGVLRVRLLVHAHVPLPVGWDAIEPPVDEHAKFCLAPPCHARIVLVRRLSRQPPRLFRRGLSCIRRMNRRCPWHKDERRKRDERDQPKDQREFPIWVAVHGESGWIPRISFQAVVLGRGTLVP